MFFAFVGIACSPDPLLPSDEQIHADIEQRRRGLEPDRGDCWVVPRFLDGEPFVDCQPGPWLESQEEVDDFRVAAQRYAEGHPERIDERLVLALTFVHVGSPVMVFLGGRPQYHLLAESPSADTVARLAPLRWGGSADFLAQQQLWRLGLEVLRTGDPLFRKQWQRLRQEVDRPGPYTYGEFQILLDETPDEEFIWQLPLTWSATLEVHAPAELRWQEALATLSLREEQP